MHTAQRAQPSFESALSGGTINRYFHEWVNTPCEWEGEFNQGFTRKYSKRDETHDTNQSATAGKMSSWPDKALVMIRSISFVHRKALPLSKKSSCTLRGVFTAPPMNNSRRLFCMEIRAQFCFLIINPARKRTRYSLLPSSCVPHILLPIYCRLCCAHF